MKLIANSNILFTLIISGKRGRIHRILRKYDKHLFMPEEALYEYRKYLKLLRDKAKELESRTLLAFTLVNIIPIEIYYEKIEEALNIAKQFDEKDVPFIAFALKLNLPKWTEDRKMLKFAFKPGKYIAFDTRAIEDLLKGKETRGVLEYLKKRLKL